MTRIWLIAILSVILYPLTGIGTDVLCSAQSMSIELNDIICNGTEKKRCPWCDELMNIDEYYMHDCRSYCPICGTKLDGNDVFNHNCSDDDSGSQQGNDGYGFGGSNYCVYCNRPYDYCNCPDIVIPGNRPSSDPWIDITIPDTPPKDDNLYNSDSIETEDETAPSDTSQQKQLNALIDRIFANISKSAYPNLSKDKYIARLKELIDNSLKIQQGNNGTCGSAVVCKWMLENNPELFINMAAGIYENGAYEINGVYLGVPTGHLWSSWLGEKSWLEVSDADITSMTNSHSVDVIMQGTITNWMNYALNYNPFEGNSDFTSMAFPNRICDFLKEFLGVSTNIISNFPSQLTYSDVKDLDFKSNFVIALVGKIQGNSFNEYIPEHYVQACSIEKNNDGYSLDYWTWGESKNRTSIVDNSQSGIFGLIIVKPQIRK